MDDRQRSFESGEPTQQQPQQQAGQHPPQAQQLPQQYPQGQAQQPQQPQGQQVAQQPPAQPEQQVAQQPQSQMGQQPAQQPPAQIPQQLQQPTAQSPTPVQQPQQAQAVGQQPPTQAQQPAAQQGYGQQPLPAQQAAPATQQAPGQYFRTDTVTDILQTDVATADRDTPLPTVVEQMKADDVGSVVVVDEGRPVGVLTDRKVALSLSDFPDLSSQQAGDLLGEEIVVGEQELSIFEALDRLNEHAIRRLPIVDENGMLAGIVTLDDILIVLGSKLTDATAIIEAQASNG